MNSSVGIGAFLGRWLVGLISSCFIFNEMLDVMNDELLFVMLNRKGE